MIRECDLPDCLSTDEVRAVRDPEGTLLDMCAPCRREWPVTRVEGGYNE